ncbi:MAG: phosphodiester glycosidase family protein, partial [Muribaculaceae bacterium]|nr:phosphodiester glycosidase family protein [Muribaculaceae bacterium]
TLYIIVIDKSNDTRYGGSSGCTSAVMCQIARHYGCSNMTNLDSGGSAQMFVLDKIQNTTTEGTPRAVANGMMVYSVAPVDETIARIEFFDRRISLPTSATVRPVVWGYNKYGQLVSDDVDGVTFAVDQTVGSTVSDGKIVVAGPNGATGYVVADYNGIQAKVPIDVIEAPFGFLSDNIVTDSNDEPVFFKSSVSGTDYVYQPANVEWGIEILEGEAPVLTVENNVMKGVSNGKVRLTADMGGRQASTTVRVQLPAAEYMPVLNSAINTDDWKINRTSVKTAAMTPIGNEGGFRLTYNVSSSRGPKVTVARDIELWGCPKSFSLDLDPGESGMTSVAVTVLPANSTRTVTLTLEADAANPGFLTAPL